MSGKSSAVMMFICVVAIALAASRAEDASVTAGSRQPASMKPALTTSKFAALKHTAKLSGPLSAAIELVGEAPLVAGDTFVVRGVVSLSSAGENVQYKWILPAGVELVNGAVSGVLGSVAEGKPYELQLTLKQVSSSNAQIHLQVLGSSGGARYGETAQFNTLLEGAIAESRKALGKSTEDAISKDSPKVVH